MVRDAVVALCLCAVLAGGCTPTSTDGPQASRSYAIPAKARIVCGPDGTRVATPQVEALPDGVHFVIDNQFEAETGYSIEFTEGGGEGDGAPTGKSEHVGDSPPGKVRVGCEKPPVDGIDVDYAVLEIDEGGSGYKPVGLECKGGVAVGGGSQYAPGAKGTKGDLVEIVRRGLSDRLREGDTVELAGYPESQDSRTVRVVRDGRVVATVAFFADAGGWLEDSTSNCAGF